MLCVLEPILYVGSIVASNLLFAHQELGRAFHVTQRLVALVRTTTRPGSFSPRPLMSLRTAHCTSYHIFVTSRSGTALNTRAVTRFGMSHCATLTSVSCSHLPEHARARRAIRAYSIVDSTTSHWSFDIPAPIVSYQRWRSLVMASAGA
jgi:hypothetical protein